MLNIEIGQRLDAYHDGKVSPSRLAVVIVDAIIPRGDLSKMAQNLWRKALKEDFKQVFDGCVYYCGPKGLSDLATTSQFWDWNCKEFIVGHILGDTNPMFFAKRPDGFDWYAVNGNYSLDLTGRIRKRNLKNWKVCAKECGNEMKWNAKEGKYDYISFLTGKKVG